MYFDGTQPFPSSSHVYSRLPIHPTLRFLLCVSGACLGVWSTYQSHTAEEDPFFPSQELSDGNGSLVGGGFSPLPLLYAQILSWWSWCQSLACHAGRHTHYEFIRAAALPCRKNTVSLNLPVTSRACHLSFPLSLWGEVWYEHPICSRAFHSILLSAHWLVEGLLTNFHLLQEKKLLWWGLRDFSDPWI